MKAIVKDDEDDNTMFGDQSLTSMQVEAVSVLYDDPSETEITFSTPPNSVRKILDKSVIEESDDSEEDVPKAKKARTTRTKTPPSKKKTSKQPKKPLKPGKMALPKRKSKRVIKKKTKK